MEVTVTHHVDDLGDMRYEYDLYEFVLGGRTMRARHYVDDAPDAIAVLGMLDPERPGVPASFYDAPEASDIVAALRDRGFKTISMLGPQGYAPLDDARLGLN